MDMTHKFTDAKEISDAEVAARLTLGLGLKKFENNMAHNAMLANATELTSRTNLQIMRPDAGHRQAVRVMQAATDELTALFGSAYMATRAEKLEYKAPEQELTVISTPKATAPKADVTIGGPLAPAKPKAKLTAPGLSFT